MTKPKLLLHPGMHKTGTTAIQESLYRNRDWLAARDIAYPALGQFGEGPKNAHHGFTKVLASGAAKSDPELRPYAEQIDHAASTARLTVLSAEPIYTHTLDSRREGALSFLQPVRQAVSSRIGFWNAHRAYLERLREFLRAFDISVLIYLRRPDGIAESLFKEGVARGRRMPSFRVHVWQLQWALRFFDYPRRLDLLRDVFYRVDTRSYEEEAKRGLVAGFYEALGLEEPPPDTASRVRTSIGNRAALWLCRERLTDSRVKMYRYRLLFAAENDLSPVFAETEPSTLWPSDRTFRAFVERNRSAYAMSGSDLPDPPGRPVTIWTDDMHRAANEAFEVWLHSNAERLTRRDKAGRRKYWDPDPD